MATVFGGEAQKVQTVKCGFAGGHMVVRVAGEHARKGALARTVGSHDGMDFARTDGEVDAAQDFTAFDACVEVGDLE